MSCSKQFDFATATGAHLSDYWTMDEAGTVDRIDSTVGNAWPLRFGASGTPGLFVNGVNCQASVVLNQTPGLNINSAAYITINQAVSTGLSVWFWIKYTSYGTAANSSGLFFLDTPDPLHTNKIQIGFENDNATGTSIEVRHTNDTTDFAYDTPLANVPLGSWQMYAVTYDKAAQTLNGYVNGVLQATGADTGVYPDLSAGFMRLTNSNANLSGTSFIAEEFGLCLNGALTADQITALYNGGVGVTWPTVTSIVPFP